MTVYQFDPANPALRTISAGLVAGGTGVVTMIGGEPFTGVRNAAGSYTFTKTTGAWSANSFLVITPTVGDCLPAQNGPIGATASVLTTSAALVAADRDFIVAVVSAA